MTIHVALKERIEQDYGASLCGQVELKQDALRLSLSNEVRVEVRFAARQEYSIAWRWRDAELRIDTAPLHEHLATCPNHLHDADGRIRSDPLTVPAREPWENLQAVLDALLADPLLKS